MFDLSKLSAEERARHAQVINTLALILTLGETAREKSKVVAGAPLSCIQNKSNLETVNTFGGKGAL